MRFLKQLIWLVWFLPLAASAHGLVTTQRQVVGDYQIEFEYNTLGSIFAGDYTIFDTYLLRASDSQPVDYNYSFIRIQKKDGPAILAGSLAESTDNKGYASISGTLNDPGTYTAEVDFYQGGKQLAQGHFDFEVKSYNPAPGAKPVTKQFLLPMMTFLAGLALGLGGMRWIKRQK